MRVNDQCVADNFSLDDFAQSKLGQGLGLDWHTGSDNCLEKEMPDLDAPVYLAGRTTSSLDLAHELVARHAFPVWSSALVLQQSAGRGQMRREWVSPPGNIYAALRLPQMSPFNCEAAAPAFGVFVAHALESLGFLVGLKWPNDILQVSLEEYRYPEDATAWDAGSIPPTAWRKAGGILLEERNGALIAGIGLNLDNHPETSQLREGFALAAGRLQSTDKNFCGLDLKKNEIKHTKSLSLNTHFSLVPLWVQLVKKIILCYSAIDYSLGQPLWLHLAQKFLAFKGWRVQLDDAVPEDFCAINSMKNLTVTGWMDGLCPSGALRLRTETGLCTFFGGSLTPLP